MNNMEPYHFTDIMHSHNYCDDLAQPFPITILTATAVI